MATVEERELRQIIDLMAVNIEDILPRLDRIETTLQGHTDKLEVLRLVALRFGEDIASLLNDTRLIKEHLGIPD